MVWFVVPILLTPWVINNIHHNMCSEIPYMPPLRGPVFLSEKIFMSHLFITWHWTCVRSWWYRMVNLSQSYQYSKINDRHTATIELVRSPQDIVHKEVETYRERYIKLHKTNLIHGSPVYWGCDKSEQYCVYDKRKAIDEGSGGAI